MFAEDRFFERWTDELLAEFATHVKIARVAPNDLLDVLEDVAAGHLMEVNDEIECNSYLFFTGTRSRTASTCSPRCT
ncbi:hypothetical protein [Streptomyces tendae]